MPATSAAADAGLLGASCCLGLASALVGLRVAPLSIDGLLGMTPFGAAGLLAGGASLL